MSRSGFTLEQRECVLARLAVGSTVEEAAAAAGVSATTISRWITRGRAPGAPPAYVEFARRVAAARAEAAENVAKRREEDEPLVFGDPGYVDPHTWICPSEMAPLTPELRQQARECYVESHPDPPPWLSSAEWRVECAGILRGERDWREPDAEHRYPWR
jgi:transposase